MDDELGIEQWPEYVEAGEDEADPWINAPNAFAARALDSVMVGHSDNVLGGGAGALSEGVQALFSDEPILDAAARGYSEGKESYRDMQADMRDAHGVADTLGGIAGALPSMGGRAALAIASRVMQGTALGVGMADADTLEDAAEAATLPGLLSAGAEAIVPGGRLAIAAAKKTLGITSKAVAKGTQSAKQAFANIEAQLPKGLEGAGDAIKEKLTFTVTGLKPAVYKFAKTNMNRLDDALDDMALGQKALERQRLASTIRNKKSVDAVDLLGTQPVDMTDEVMAFRRELQVLASRADAGSTAAHRAKLQELLDIADASTKHQFRTNPVFVALQREAKDLAGTAKSQAMAPAGDAAKAQLAQVNARLGEMTESVLMAPKDIKLMVKASQDLGYARKLAEGDTNDLAQGIAKQWGGKVNEKLASISAEYAEAMKGVSELSSITGTSGVQQFVTRSTKPEALGKTLRTRAFDDSTVGRTFQRLDDVLERNMDAVKQLASEGDEVAKSYLATAEKLTDQSKLSGTAAALATDASRGSRGTNMGAMLGASGGAMLLGPVGGVIGGVVGGAAGYALDRNRDLWLKAPDVAARMLESGTDAFGALRKASGQRFEQVRGNLERVGKMAETTGPAAARALHLQLMKREPEYRQSIEGMEAAMRNDPELGPPEGEALNADTREALIKDMMNERLARAGIEPRAVQAAKAILSKREARVDPRERKKAMAQFARAL